MSTDSSEPSFSRPLSRRTLLKIAGLATGGLFLAACEAAVPDLDETPTVEPTPVPDDEPTPVPEATPTPDDEEPTPEPEPTPDADEPRRGRRLRWGTITAPDGFFDPALATGFPMWTSGFIYEQLVGIDEDYAELIPRLATSWESEEDGRVWVFELREGVMFHHGREFVAEDVVHTFERILDPDFASPARSVFENITQVEAEDDYTVRFELATANADFPVLLTGMQPKIVPYDLTDDEINSEPRGTGPFRIDNYVNADRVVFYRNEDYWQEGRPYLDELETVTIPEATTLINTLQAGDIDAVYQIPPPLMPMVDADENLELLFGPPIQKDHIFMRLDVEPFDDERVRRAFKLIPDREAMTELVWGDIPARPDDDNPVIPTSPMRLESEIWQQDLEEARRLLEEAGYGDGLEIDLYAMNDQFGVVEFCLAFADWAEQAGVTVNIVGVPSGRYYAENWLEVSLGTVEWTPRATIDEQLRIAYHSEAPWNETRYRNEDFDAMLDEALGETDEERRAELYEEIQRKLITEGGQIIHAHYPSASSARQNVRGFIYHPLDALDPRTVWLADQE
jgi:peptide/nickel transport system substrate-binding protein